MICAVWSQIMYAFVVWRLICGITSCLLHLAAASIKQVCDVHQHFSHGVTHQGHTMPVSPVRKTILQSDLVLLSTERWLHLRLKRLRGTFCLITRLVVCVFSSRYIFLSLWTQVITQHYCILYRSESQLTIYCVSCRFHPILSAA